MTKVFSIYRSSAGSGKTRTLAKEYLKLALQFRAEYFKHILAVTFTNKASQEMKTRILSYLDAFARGEGKELADELKSELGFDDQTFQQHAQEVQRAILHQYSQFSISTIDAFFQKVIRSFTRESGLIGDYRLEVDHDTILEEAIDNLIEELGRNKQLTDWIVEFANENLQNERPWDVRQSLVQFAREIFREEFKSIEDQVQEKTSGSGYFKGVQSQLWDIKNSFLDTVSVPAKAALARIKENGWLPNDFSYGKGSGIMKCFETFAFSKDLSNCKGAIGVRMRSHFTIAENWAHKDSPHKHDIYKSAQEVFVPALLQIIDTFDGQFVRALSAEAVIKNLYVFGLISDIARKLKEYKDENNVMLLADAPKFLNGIIQDSDTPFIYEKVGSFYRNYLIDEFQDTSGMQWNNFRPLIENALDQGYQGLVVGDVKQAIYRWRGGDLNLLQRDLGNSIGAQRIEAKVLDSNFRSSKAIVNFNNLVFASAAKQLSSQTGTTLATDVYHDIAQRGVIDVDGFVDIQFLEEPADDSEQETEEPADAKKIRWTDIALNKIPERLERLQEIGVPLKDVTILVRKNDEGQRIAAHLLEYRSSDKAKPGYSYDVVSNESLRIDSASTVNLLLAALRYLLNQEDVISRAQLAYEFNRLQQSPQQPTAVFTVSNRDDFERSLPDAFSAQKISLKKLPLIELTERLIEIFKLGSQRGELVYVQAFQDLVLEFSNRERNDLGAFLEWWKENRHKKSVQVSADVDAVQIMTIHKSKGLQFRYVIIPFCSWKLDHEVWQAPNLWVRSDISPFDQMGFVPVKYGSGLTQTVFSADYEQERTKTYLDNLNLLYVALTRAERGLFITAPHHRVRGAKDSVASLLAQSMFAEKSFDPYWKTPECHWSSGILVTITERTSEPVNALSLTDYLSSDWREKIVIRQSANDFFCEEGQHKRRINEGIAIHNVLSKMHYADQLQDALTNALQQGLIVEEERQRLLPVLMEFLNIPQVAGWFDRKWEVSTEVPILLPSGEECRLDRLLIFDRTAIVIDFKTGAQNRRDTKQVSEYLAVLQSMNFTSVSGYLLYLRSQEIVEVSMSNRGRIEKSKPNTSQLSFEL